MLDEQIKKQFGSWTAFSNSQNENPKNFKRKILGNIDRLDKWLEPAELQIQIVLKKQTRVGKNKTKMNNWIEYGDIKLENGVYYELAFWNKPVKHTDGVVVKGSFTHQGILKFDNGFKVNGYWLRPTPTHIRKIEPTTPDYNLCVEK